MQIQYNQAPKKKGRSIANTKGLWVKEGSFYPCDKSMPGAIYFDSYLELMVYKHLITIFGVNGVQRQHKVHIASDLETGLNLAWCADFYITALGKAVEAKGKWINTKGNESHKTLFIWQYVACKTIGQTDLVVVSDSNFSISQIPVLDYREAFPLADLEF